MVMPLRPCQDVLSLWRDCLAPPPESAAATGGAWQEQALGMANCQPKQRRGADGCCRSADGLSGPGLEAGAPEWKAEVPPPARPEQYMTEEVAALQQPPSVYRSPSFVKLWASQVVSKAGANFVEVALAVFAMSLAHGDLAAYGGMLLAGMLPAVVLGWAVGGVADRWDKRRTLVTGDMVRAVLVLSIPLVGQLWWAYAAVFLVETVGLVYKPGIRALTPDTVGDGQVMAANAALAAGLSAADIPAYLLVGLVVARTGVLTAFVVDAVAFAVAGVTLATLVFPPQVSAPRAGAATGFWSDIREGFDYHRRHPIVGRILILSMVGVMGVAGINVASAAVITVQLGRPEAELGWLLAGIAAGTWVGATFMGRLGPDERRYPVYMGVGFFGFGLFAAALAFSHNLYLSLGLYVLGGFFNATFQLPMRAWLQGVVPREMRGRVFAARGMGIGVTSAIATILTGVLVAAWRLPPILDVLGALVVAASALAIFWLGRAARAQEAVALSLPPTSS